jgi:hypothetical protein
MWCHTPVIPALERLRQEDCNFQGHPGLYSETHRTKSKTKKRHGGAIALETLERRESKWWQKGIVDNVIGPQISALPCWLI